MNHASEDPVHHLAVLKERLLPPSDYEKAFHYFLEEFGGDAASVVAGTPEVMPQLDGVLNRIATKTLGKPVQLEGARFNRIAEHRFQPGAARLQTWFLDEAGRSQGAYYVVVRRLEAGFH